MTGKVEAYKCDDCGQLFESVQKMAAHQGANEFGRMVGKSLPNDDSAMRTGLAAVRFRMLLNEALELFPAAVEAACTTYFDTLARFQPVSINTPMTDGNEQESPNG